MTVARLFPDFAATPTPTERATARRNNQRLQLDMFGIDTANTPTACPACGSFEHDAEGCRYHAPSLLDDAEHRADELAAMRARFDTFNVRADARADRAAR